MAVIVEDDGPGISAEMRSQVPTRGVRADEACWHGLGLAIVRISPRRMAGRSCWTSRRSAVEGGDDLPR